jgi:putative membrane protein
MKNTNWKPFMMGGVIIVMLLFIGLIFVAMMLFRAGSIDSGMMQGGSGMMQGGWWPGMWGIGPFMMIVPCFGVIMILFMAFFFFPMMSDRGGPMSGMMDRSEPMSRTPLEILKKRYASGEITKEEFDQMKKDLEDSG